MVFCPSFQLRNGGSVLGSECLPVQWVEAQASGLLLTLLQQCATQYELCRLLQLLADMDRMLKSTGKYKSKLWELNCDGNLYARQKQSHTFVRN